MKILFLTYDLPFPLDSGGKIRAYYLIKGLARDHQLTLFSFYREKEQLRYLKEVRKFCHQIKVFKRRDLISPANLLFLPGLPFPAALYSSPTIRKEINSELKRKNYDLVHFESFYTSMYVDQSLRVPQILGTENIEWRVYFEYAKEQRLPVIREVMMLEVLRIRRFEEKSWKKADICLAVSKENAEEIEKITGKKCYVIPNGVDLEYFKFNQKTRLPARQARKLANKRTILFVGNFKYLQNQDAVKYLVNEIFPLIKKEIENSKLLIVGRYPTRKIKALAREDVVVEDKIEDIREAYRQADVLLAPLRAGSGTKFKVLEAMATGVPVVTTRVGSEGIEGEDGKEFLIREKPEELARATVELLENEDLRQRLAINARRLVKEKYSWERIVRKLEKAYQAVVKS